MKIRKVVLLVVFAGVLLGVVGQIAVQRVYAGLGWATAYEVDFTHWDKGLPHFGAYFPGGSGSSQYYTGPTGQPSGYASWNWWGASQYVLLLEKSWLFLHTSAWVGSNHHAYMNAY